MHSIKLFTETVSNENNDNNNDNNNDVIPVAFYRHKCELICLLLIVLGINLI